MGTCMRKALIVGLISLATAGVASAQQEPYRDPQGQAHLNQTQSGSQTQSQSQHNRNQPPTPSPTTPPVPRCADLAVTTLGFVSTMPGAPAARGGRSGARV